MWAKICRVCSSSADYEVFAKIPNYLHATSNEFINWQKPINVLLEETTGLKVTQDDGLPHTICAVCISYLKHSVVFREQVINNAMSLKALQLLDQRPVKTASGKSKRHHKQQKKQQQQLPSISDKESLLITEQDLNFSEQRQVDANLLLDKGLQEPDKACKALLNNKGLDPSAVQQNLENDMRYINLLFDKDINTGMRGLRSKNQRQTSVTTDEDQGASGSGGDRGEIPTTTSSDENDENPDGAKTNEINGKQQNIFSYREKNFEEDDVMDLDELRDVVSINIPKNCKERKCPACARRFMFEDTYNEHMNNCIEYRFLMFIEEANRLITIRRDRALSPHEFIRRMIFCMRKTCDWLKNNCFGILLPDLQVGNGSNGTGSSTNGKQRLESEGKNSVGSSTTEGKSSLTAMAAATADELLSMDGKQHGQTPTALLKPTDIILPRNETQVNGVRSFMDSVLDIDRQIGCVDKKFSNNFVGAGSIAAGGGGGTPRSLTSGRSTPINASNNILYEIERSQSHNSNPTNLPNIIDLSSDNQELRKPIAMHAINTTTNNAATTTPPEIATTVLNLASGNCQFNDRMTFLEKLQRAACQTPPVITTAQMQQQLHLMSQYPPNSVPVTPLIGVRKDLMPDQQLPPSKSKTPMTPGGMKFIARCNPCSVYFEAVAELEIHNAKHHNAFIHQSPNQVPNHMQQSQQQQSQQQNSTEHEVERLKIIALFEESG